MCHLLGPELVQDKQGRVPMRKEPTLCMRCFCQHSDWWKTRSHCEEKHRACAYTEPPPPLNINTGVRQMRPTASLHTALHWSPEATTHSTWWDEGSAFERIFAASACRLRLRADKWQGIIVLGLFFFKSWMLYFKFFLWLYFSWPFLGVKGRRSSPTVCYPSLSLMTQAFMELTPSRGDKMTSCWFSSCQWGHFFLSPHRSPPLKTVTVE